MLEKQELEMFYPSSNPRKIPDYINNNYNKENDYHTFIGIVTDKNIYYNVYIFDKDFIALTEKYNIDRYELIKWYKEQYLNNI